MTQNFLSCLKGCANMYKHSLSVLIFPSKPDFSVLTSGAFALPAAISLR